jgi:hypothetical protein
MLRRLAAETRGCPFQVRASDSRDRTRISNGALLEAFQHGQVFDVVIPQRYRRLLGVGLFLGILLAVFQVFGLRDHFNLAFIRELILQHRIGGLMLFVLLFFAGQPDSDSRLGVSRRSRDHAGPGWGVRSPTLPP